MLEFSSYNWGNAAVLICLTSTDDKVEKMEAGSWEMEYRKKQLASRHSEELSLTVLRGNLENNSDIMFPPSDFKEQNSRHNSGLLYY